MQGVVELTLYGNDHERKYAKEAGMPGEVKCKIRSLQGRRNWPLQAGVLCDKNKGQPIARGL